jgi:hypothetical protein
MRRYDDPVEVRRGRVPGSEEGPAQFLWHGRLWKVRAVVAHWVETGPWWQSSGAHAVLGAEQTEAGPVGLAADLVSERELWRVEAARGAAGLGRGVFDLAFDWADGNWQLVRCVD